MGLAVQAMPSCDSSEVTRNSIRENFNCDLQPLPSEKGSLSHTLSYYSIIYGPTTPSRCCAVTKTIQTSLSHFTDGSGKYESSRKNGTSMKMTHRLTIETSDDPKTLVKSQNKAREEL